MSDYPPRGKELKILNKIRKAYKDLGPPPCSHGFVHLDIDLDFAIKGVRTNGHEQTTTLFDVHKRLSEEDNDLQQEKRDLDAWAEKVAAFRELVESLVGDEFNICPVCHGEKGERISGKGIKAYEWVDCGRCKGRGIIPLK